MRRIRLILAILITLVANTAARADQIIGQEELDALARPAIDQSWAAGLVIAIIRDGKTQVVGYGTKSDQSNQPPDGQTVFEIGSITKVFTGTLLADMVERKEVSLDDPVSRYLPESVKVPSFEGQPITLLDLATQRSGLPRLPNNLPAKKRLNPYAGYTPQLLYAFLSSYKLTRAPGAQYEYSNLGVGLLGHALSLHAGKTYEQLVLDRICHPLEMNSTRAELDDTLRTRLAQGHGPDGEPVPNWDIPTLTSAGGFKSTADDLLKFLAGYLEITPTELTPAMRLATQRQAKIDYANDIGLCWCIDSIRDMPWHNGQTGGYRSFIAFHPKRHFGVVVLANTSTPVVDQIAIRLTLRLLGRKLAPLDLPKEAPLQSNAQAICGRYMLSHQQILAVTMEAGRLYCKGTGQPRCRMYPEAAGKFFLKAADAKISFDQNDNGQVTDLVLHQNGADQPAMRLP